MAHAALLAYVIVGPVLAGVMVAFALLGRSQLRRRRHDAYPLPDPAPPAVALVPVRDEREAIATCLTSLLAQDYPDFRVIACDDRSTDGTRDTLADLAREHAPRLAVLHVDALPAGWLGKPHALHVARQHPFADDARWLVFVDSDVVVEPDAVRRVVATAEARRWDAASLLTRLVAPTTLEKTVAPLAAGVWMTLFRGTETNRDARPSRAVANGQFLAARADACDDAGGHEAVRDTTCEDVALFRLMKSRGRRVRLLDGTRLASTRMHATWRQMYHGWARNVAGTARHDARYPVAAALAVVPHVLPVPVLVASASLVSLSQGWVWASASHLVAAAAWSWVVARGAGLRRREAVVTTLLHPAGLALVVVLLLNATRACLGGRILWRGDLVRA